MRRLVLPIIIAAVALCGCLPDDLSSYEVKQIVSGERVTLSITLKYEDQNMCGIVTPYDPSNPEIKKLYDDCKARWAIEIQKICKTSIYDEEGDEIPHLEGTCGPEDADDYTNKNGLCLFTLTNELAQDSAIVLKSKCESQGFEKEMSSPSLLVPESTDVCELEPDSSDCSQPQPEEGGGDFVPLGGTCRNDPQAEGCDGDGDGVAGSDDQCPNEPEAYDADGETPLDGILDGCDETLGAAPQNNYYNTPSFASGEQGSSCTLTALPSQTSVIPQLVLFVMALYGLALARAKGN